MRSKLRLPADVAADLSVSVSPGKDARNPHMFYVTLGGPQVLGSAKVKVVLWQAQADALAGLALNVSTVQSVAGQAFVPTLTLEEIFADKVYALGGRARIKPRDVFDLWWLRDKAVSAPSKAELKARLAIYPTASGQLQDTAQVWLANAASRLQELQAPGAAAWIATDLKRWLPSFWPLALHDAEGMTALAAEQLQSGMRVMQDMLSELSAGNQGSPA